MSGEKKNNNVKMPKGLPVKINIADWIEIEVFALCLCRNAILSLKVDY